MKMLILRGIAGTFSGRDYPDGALDEPSALEYARRRGYRGEVLDCSGEAYENSPQVRATVAAYRADPTIVALYGFSGGGYNLRHVLKRLSFEEKDRLELVVVLGAPHAPREDFAGHWELVYRVDPAEGHMAGPRVLLSSVPPEPPPAEEPAPWWLTILRRLFRKQ